LSGLKVLIVDDNAHLRRIARAIVAEINDAEVRECIDGRSAIDLSTTWPADIALVDYEMAPMDGVEFTRMVRSGKTPLRRDLPIVMMTGHADQSHVLRARDAGVSGFIAKPLSVAMVIRQIERTAAASRAPR
jgi:CheY-like chemotaxis protein